MMNKSFVFRLMIIMTLLVSFCGIAAAQEAEEGDPGAIIDLNGSEVYTNADMEAAAEKIIDEFSTWEGCELHVLSYAGDAISADELEYINSMDKGVFDECAVFDSAFRSPKTAYGAWEADREYTWSWFLGRAEKGEWQLLSWGWTEDYLKSEQYSEEDLFAGRDLILAKLAEMDGVEFHFMRYAGDEFSNSELEYVNSLDRGVYDECAVYYVSFQSPKTAYGAWEPDMLYTWSFYLARAEKGEWNLITYGY